MGTKLVLLPSKVYKCLNTRQMKEPGALELTDGESERPSDTVGSSLIHRKAGRFYS